MILTTKINLVKGDINYDLQFVIYDINDTIVSLAGISTLYLKIKKYQEKTAPISIVGIVMSASLGTCKFNLGEAFKTEYGEYRAEIELNFLSGAIITAPNIVILVQNDLS